MCCGFGLSAWVRPRLIRSLTGCKAKHFGQTAWSAVPTYIGQNVWVQWQKQSQSRARLQPLLYVLERGGSRQGWLLCIALRSAILPGCSANFMRPYCLGAMLTVSASRRSS